jgi:hypothetical protein
VLAYKVNTHNTQSGWRILKRSFNPFTPFLCSGTNIVYSHLLSLFKHTITRHCVYIPSIVLVITMHIGKKAETTLELLERLTREARERQELQDSDSDSEKSSELGEEVKEE